MTSSQLRDSFEIIPFYSPGCIPVLLFNFILISLSSENQSKEKHFLQFLESASLAFVLCRQVDVNV